VVALQQKSYRCLRELFANDIGLLLNSIEHLINLNQIVPILILSFLGTSNCKLLRTEVQNFL
jgi:hypothetical protein